VAVVPEIDLGLQPTPDSGGRADADVKVAEIAVIQREIRVKPQESVGDAGHGAVDASGEGTGAQHQDVPRQAGAQVSR
jgi:hypothetical protein